jgi:hypothetical protein
MIGFGGKSGNGRRPDVLDAQRAFAECSIGQRAPATRANVPSGVSGVVEDAVTVS